MVHNTPQTQESDLPSVLWKDHEHDELESGPPVQDHRETSP